MSHEHNPLNHLADDRLLHAVARLGASGALWSRDLTFQPASQEARSCGIAVLVSEIPRASLEHARTLGFRLMKSSKTKSPHPRDPPLRYKTPVLKIAHPPKLQYKAQLNLTSQPSNPQAADPNSESASSLKPSFEKKDLLSFGNSLALEAAGQPLGRMELAAFRV